MRRKISYEILNEVIVKKRHAHLVLKEYELEANEQAFVSALVYSVLQNKMYLEYQYEDLVKRKPNNRVNIILLMASAQLFKMDKIPDYALVNEYVDLSKKVKEKHSAGFINAVLNQMVKRGERLPDLNTIEGVSLYNSMPLWILKLLQSQYSFSFAKDYAEYVQSIKPTYAWVNKLKIDTIDAEYFIDKDLGIVDPSVFRTSLLDEAKLVIQDINSQAVVDLMPIKEDMRILDCCCAPGTKTLRIANALNNTGEIVGVDVHQSRVDVTIDLMKRANVKNAEILLADAQEVSFAKEFDMALIDAPCSGLGVLSHKHDLRYNIKPEDLDDLERLQANILDNVAKYIKKEAYLFYATCTLNKKENERQIERFLERHENFELVFEKTFDPLLTKGDGFYVAQCRKKW